MPARKCRNNLEVLTRRESAMFLYLEGNSCATIAKELGVDKEQIRQDINAMLDILKRVDGLQQVSESRTRVLAALWDEVQLAHRQEEAACDLTEPDYRAASAYQANRIKAVTLISKLTGIEKPDPEDNPKKMQSWLDLAKEVATRSLGIGSPRRKPPEAPLESQD